MSRKKVGIIIGIVAVAAVAVVGGLYVTGRIGGTGNSADKVYVQSVSTIMQQYGGDGNRYSGVIQPQDTLEVNKDSDKTIAEVFVKEGDEVSEGTQLFSYDTEDMELQLEQQKLELEDIANEISGYNTQIAELQAEKASAPADQQFEYTTQIQTAQTSIKQSEYKQKSKQAEIDKTKKSIDNAVVTSKIAGVVKSINDSGVDESGNTVAYMTILATGDYQVKGSVNETNLGMLTQGQTVLIRSRIDEDLTWTGTISKIDTENTVSDNTSGYYSSSGDDTTTSTKYPFYVTLDSMDGLTLGQHVYIELDMGQETAKDGLWLYSYYIVQDDGDPYVWVANGRDKLEKRTVELGDYDENLDEYEIKSGLAEEDLIAWPMPGLYEGVTTVTNEEEVDYTSPLYNQGSTEALDTQMMLDESMYGTEVPLDESVYSTELQNQDITYNQEDGVTSATEIPADGSASSDGAGVSE